MERLVTECDVCGKDVTNQRHLSAYGVGFSDAPPLTGVVAICSEACYQQFYGLLPSRLEAQEKRVNRDMEQAEKELIKPYAVGQRLPYAPIYPSGLR